MSLKSDCEKNKWVVTIFWLAMMAYLGVCVYFMIHNAYWQIGDEAIVISHTGMGKPFSPKGFEGMVSSYGRLYPFAYNNIPNLFILIIIIIFNNFSNQSIRLLIIIQINISNINYIL